MLRVTVNGEVVEVAEGTSVADLLVMREVVGPAAVERNRVVVPRRDHPRTLLEDGDRLEVVTLVGGG